MRHALVIARRELAEKRFVAYAALGFAVLPFLLAMIPLIRGSHTTSEIIATSAGMLAPAFAAGLALVLGATVIGRDLSEGRLSFYFARPIGAAAVWFGKVAASLALIAGAFLIIIVPALLAATDGWKRSWGSAERPLALFAIALSLVLFFVAHVVGSLIRSRSAWIGIDFAALCLAALGAYALIRPLMEAMAPKAAFATAALIAAGILVALIGGGAWQLERGRTDRKRSHIALSTFVWIAIGAGLALAGAFVAWIRLAPLSALTTLHASRQANGPWVVVGGQTKGRLDYMTAFVYNTETDTYSRMPLQSRGRFLFTRDGASMIVAQADRRTNRVEFYKRAVDRGTTTPTGLTASTYGDIVTNDDGSRIALIDKFGMLTVYDVPQKRSMMSARLPEAGGYVQGMFFVTPALVRVYAVSKADTHRTLRIYDLDVDARALRETGSFSRPAKYLGILASADGSRLLGRANDAIYVLDGRTAAVQATIPHGVNGIDFLRNGGFVNGRPNGDRLTVEMRDAAGVVTRTFDVNVRNNWGLRELSDGRLLTIERGKDNVWSTVLIDPNSGAVTHKIPAAPVGWRDELGWLGRDPRRLPLDVPKLFTDAKRLLRWNYATNQAEVLLPRS